MQLHWSWHYATLTCGEHKDKNREILSSLEDLVIGGRVHFADGVAQRVAGARRHLDAPADLNAGCG